MALLFIHADCVFEALKTPFISIDKFYLHVFILIRSFIVKSGKGKHGLFFKVNKKARDRIAVV